MTWYEYTISLRTFDFVPDPSSQVKCLRGTVEDHNPKGIARVQGFLSWKSSEAVGPERRLRDRVLRGICTAMTQRVVFPRP